MSRRSRKGGKKNPRLNVYLSIFIAAILIVSVGGFYVYENSAKTNQTTTTSSTSSSSSSTASGTGPYAVLDTSQGTIVIELFPSVAPVTVSNFESLANQGFYNNLVWHRIVAGFVIQTGDPNTRDAVNSTRSTWGQGQGPYTEPLEANSNYSNGVGYVAIAHTSSTTSGGSQFYINLADNSELNGQYTVFGKVIQGMNVVDAIAALPVYTNSNSFTFDQPINAQSALLISITIQSTP
jgi:cyclophilin family peptidyl-prolyl cis-trans isomerase